MSAEKIAFISTYDKQDLEELAVAVHEADFEIVSLGGTGGDIEKFGIPVIPSEEFVAGRIDPNMLLDLEERERRGIVGAQLAQCMSLRREKLNGTNRNAIDLVYINLIPPAEIYDEAGRLGYKRDRDGVLMLEAALEGSRTVLNLPDQIPYFARFLETGPYEFEATENHRLSLARQANEYLVTYASLAGAVGRVGASQASSAHYRS